MLSSGAGVSGQHGAIADVTPAGVFEGNVTVPASSATPGGGKAALPRLERTPLFPAARWGQGETPAEAAVAWVVEYRNNSLVYPLARRHVSPEQILLAQLAGEGQFISG